MVTYYLFESARCFASRFFGSKIDSSIVVPRPLLRHSITEPLHSDELFSPADGTAAVFCLAVIHGAVRCSAIRKEQERIFNWANLDSASGERRGAAFIRCLAIRNRRCNPAANLERMSLAFAVAMWPVLSSSSVLHQIHRLLPCREEGLRASKVPRKRI